MQSERSAITAAPGKRFVANEQENRVPLRHAFSINRSTVRGRADVVR